MCRRDYIREPTIGMRGKIHDWMENYFSVDHVETGKSVTNSCLLSETMEG